MFFYKKNWTDFVSCAWAGLVGNIGKFPSIDYQWRILWQSRPIKKWKQNFQLSHTFLATKQNHNKSNHKKMKTFSIIFSLLSFIVKKNNNNKKFIFFQISHTFSMTKHNHTTKYNHKTYKKTSGAMVSQTCTSLPSYWCWGKDLHSMISVRENGFSGRWQNKFWGKEENRLGGNEFPLLFKYKMLFFSTLILCVKKYRRIGIIFQSTTFYKLLSPTTIHS